jgi:hypothetical protein
MSGIGQVTEEMKSEGRIERSERERESETTRARAANDQTPVGAIISILPLSSLSLPGFPMRFSLNGGLREYHVVFGFFFSQTPIAILGTSCDV